MNFTNDKPIYIQMSDRLCEEILSGVYKDDDRIPSVREYAVLLEVNTISASLPSHNNLCVLKNSTGINGMSVM